MKKFKTKNVNFKLDSSKIFFVLPLILLFLAKSITLQANNSSLIFPVLVVDAGAMDIESKNQIIRMLTTAFEKSVKTQLAVNYYGTGAKYKFKSKGGYFDSLNKFQEKLLSNLTYFQKNDASFRQSIGNDNQRIRIELLWSMNRGSGSEQILKYPIFFKSLVSLLGSSGDESIFYDFFDATGLSGLRVLDLSKQSDHAKEVAIRGELGSVYRYIHKTYGPQTLPLRMAMDLRVSGTASLSLNTQVDIIPENMAKMGEPLDPKENSQMKGLIMNAMARNDRQVALRVMLYQVTGPQPVSELHFEFDWFSKSYDDVHDEFEINSFGKVNALNSLPTIWVQVHTKLIPGFDFATGGVNNIDVYIKKLVFDLNTKKIIQSKSVLPIAFKNYDGSTAKVTNKGSKDGYALLSLLAEAAGGYTAGVASNELEIKFQDELKAQESQFTELMRPISKFL